MPTQLPPKEKCLNCLEPLQESDKYCPNCGQENADKRVSLGLLLKDSFATAFNLESRFFKTIPAFLFKPGKLTTEFLSGRRIKYVHPFRLYLVCSILFIFILIKLVSPLTNEFFHGLRDGITYPNTDSTNVSEGVLSEFVEGYDGDLDSPNQTRHLIDSLKLDSIKSNYLEVNFDIDNDSLEKLTYKALDSLGEAKDKTNSEINRFFDLISDRNMKEKALLDSLGIEGNGYLTSLTANQLLKIGRNDPVVFVADTFNNIGTLMFFTLPLLALYFIPFYIRRNKYYLDHLIFTLHLQAFTFFLLTVCALLLYWELPIVAIILLSSLIVYSWFAYKRVYGQGWFKTTIKMGIISFLYVCTLVNMLAIDLIYSFFMF